MTGARFLVAAALLTLVLPASVMAQEGAAVTAARSAGVVGERFDGYLGMVAGAGEPLRRQVAAINIKRRSLYASLAARRGVSSEAVGIAAACQILERVAPGEAYLLGDKIWRRRQPGESAPRPDYCG